MFESLIHHVLVVVAHFFIGGHPVFIWCFICYDCATVGAACTSSGRVSYDRIVTIIVHLVTLASGCRNKWRQLLSILYFGPFDSAEERVLFDLWNGEAHHRVIRQQ